MKISFRINASKKACSLKMMIIERILHHRFK